MAYKNEGDTRVSRFKRTKRAKLIQILLLIGVAVVLSIMAMLIPSKASPSNVQAANEAVKNLYMDDASEYLRPEVTEEEITATIKEVESLVDSQEDVYQEALQAQAKYNAVAALKRIYDTDVDITPDKEAEDVLILQEDVTAEMVHNLSDEHQLTGASDDMSLVIQEYFANAEAVINKVADATAMIDAVPTELTKKENLPEIVEQVQVIESLLAELKEQPQTKVLETTFDERITGLSDDIIEQQDSLSEDEPLLDAIFECQSFVEKLSGSPLDQRKLISLTFDDGPNPDITPQILAVLDEYDVIGTFFVLGSEVEMYPDIAKQIVEEGHIIANHSYNHPRFSDLSDEEVMAEIEKTQAAIYEATDTRPTLYRMPYGDGGARVVNLLPDLTSIIWNIDSEDWVSRDAYVIYLDVMENLLQHSLLLMHDKHQATVDALDLIIPELLAQDYLFVTPEEIGMKDLYYY